MIMKMLRLIQRGCAVAILSALGTALAVSPAELQKQLATGERLTLVDIRSQAAFQAGHIPNAINLPASLVPLKQLPPLGRVIVYDDGLGPDTAAAAAAALNAKPGIQAYPLEGGFAAWESMPAAPSTRAAGVATEELPIITYDQLKHAETTNVVLMDLRQPPAAARAALAQPATPAHRLTDLKAEFPHARIVKGSPAPAVSNPGGDAGPPPLLVLIDNGDGTAQRTARQLKAKGVKRFAILLGGEEMIARQGQPGLNRQGSSIVVESPNRPVSNQ